MKPRVSPPRIESDRRRGSALIVALAVLALLTVFITAMMTVMRHERLASANHVLDQKARLLAEAGWQRAIAELRTSELDQPFPTTDAPWAFHGDEETGSGAGVALADARHPSFAAGTDDAGAWSGVLGATFRDAGDRYVLRIADTASQIHLGLPGERLAPMLDTLGRAIAQERADRGLTAIDPIAGRGAAIVSDRDARGGFRSEVELAEVIGAADYALVRDYVCVDAWIDESTTRPIAAGPGAEVPRFEREPRAPINVNTASRPVLIAAIRGLALRGEAPITEPQARRVADEIIRRREGDDLDAGPITSWRRFGELAESLRDPATGGLSSEQVIALLVNANPNLFIAELNPDRVINRGAGKADLAVATTELTFLTMGVYEIESIGRVLDPDGAVAAEAHLESVVRIYDLARITTQRELEAARVPGEHDATATFPNALCEAGTVGASTVSGYVQLRTDVPVLRSRVAAGSAASARDEVIDALAIDPATTASTEPAGFAPSGQLDQDVQIGPSAAQRDQNAQLDQGGQNAQADAFAPARGRANVAGDVPAAERALGTALARATPGALQKQARVSARTAVARHLIERGRTALRFDGDDGEPLEADSGGDLFPDGVHEARTKRRTFTTSSDTLSLVEGSLELWFKLDAGAIDDPIVRVTHPLTATVGVQHEVRVTRRGERLAIASERLFYDLGDDDAEAFPVPFELSRSLVEASIEGAGVPNEWHHLALAWRDGTDHEVVIDGARVPPRLREPAELGPHTGAPPYDARLQLGGSFDAAGTGRFVDVTFDEIVLTEDGAARADAPPPERFRSAGRGVVGRFVGEFPAFLHDARLGALVWTEQLPDGYGSIEFDAEVFDASVGLRIRGVEFVAPPGSDFVAPNAPDAPQSAATTEGLEPDESGGEESDDDDDEDEDEDDERAETEQRMQEHRDEAAEQRRQTHGQADQEIAEADAELARGDITPAEHASQVAASEAWRADRLARIDADEQHDLEGEQERLDHKLSRDGHRDGDDRPAAPTASPDASPAPTATPTDRATAGARPATGRTVRARRPLDAIDLAAGGGSSSSGGGAGRPGIILAGESVEFSVEFTYDRADAPPLNVSPVLDDVTLTFQGPLEVVSFRWVR